MLSCKSLLWKRKRTKNKTNNELRSKTSGIKQNLILEKYQSEDEDEEINEGFSLKASTPSHTHGIRPLENFYLNSSSVNSRNTGLGNLQNLTNELVIDILGLLGATHLGVLATGRKSFYLCANLEMKPEWLERDNIIRKKGISVEEFVSNFEEPNKPVLLEGCIDNWVALQKWDRDYLVKLSGDLHFSVGPVEMKLENYSRYSYLLREERPLYLFDPKFVEKVPRLSSEYEVSVYFREDLFGLLGNERPDYRWIIIGPAGSGSSFHIDPNSTSAWNAVIKGSKKWVMFPPDVTPPGVHPSLDGAEVACPVSIIEWFMIFYGATKTWKKKPIVCL
uniref:JmjC domain-containing protein n=1 Tax=Cannabis sativa TaxID=3483 RepID=A0A803NP96_CANSA